MRRIGIDMVEVARLETAIRRSGEGFLKKAFTARELKLLGQDPERLAGRWAAKEAVIKCFDGTGYCLPRRKIEVLAAPSGAPVVRLLGPLEGTTAMVSITHHGGMAVAAAELDLPEPALRPLVAPDAVRIPERPLEAHKGTFGTAVVLAGSLGLTGAAYLTSTAAARAGAGMVRLLVAEGIYPILAAKCTEVMATPVPEVAPGAVGHSATAAVLRQLETAAAAVIGPGLGRDSSTWRLVLDLLTQLKVPAVLDADALNALADNQRMLKRIQGNRVLTPHPGEMARLVRKPATDIQSARDQTAAKAAAEWGVVVVLKGAKTVVAAPDGRLSVDPHEVPALASGGTGDVLSGVIGGLLAQGLDPFEAAVTGVYVHAEAGRRVAARLGDSGLLASDLLPEVPAVMQTLRLGGF
ncbi:MAG TPA: NAD(P)H-hydrate dehydratase [Candidatus Dormibacteraeota bacterium]